MEAAGHHNIDEILKQIAQIEARADDLRPVFDEIANHLYNLTEEALESETSPDGTPWEPLSPITIERKGHDRMLEDQRDLRESIGYDSDHEPATVGVNALSKTGYPYPAVQQEGTENGHVPARPYFPFDEDGDLMDVGRDGIIDFVVDHFAHD
ncbi:hypothetical protein AB835_04715 [Candidatus Endobugula sertula]|uniref:Phage virion morphogenesis protein n=1 Tax=Candidatus Endobugula sertula TaxID=62101 RepID=A0A1D2QRH0_9GAMM|nr:hypothetical protein AB835_04715 [Candidatus Endobugula sertula]